MCRPRVRAYHFARPRLDNHRNNERDNTYRGETTSYRIPTSPSHRPIDFLVLNVPEHCNRNGRVGEGRGTTGAAARRGGRTATAVAAAAALDCLAAPGGAAARAAFLESWIIYILEPALKAYDPK